MRLFCLAAVVGSLVFLSCPSSASAFAQKPFPPPLEAWFRASFEKAEGCALVYDVEKKTLFVHKAAFCKKPLAPCSTFKIPHALVGLEAGVVLPETLWSWDRKPRWLASWNRDHTLKTAIQESVVWYFQRLASKIGAERMKASLQAFRYGNHDISGGIDRFWLQSTLQISAFEQMAFLQALYNDSLPAKKENLQTLKKLLLLKETPLFQFSGKTGTGVRGKERTLGWFVGYAKVEKRDLLVVFVMTASEKAHGPRLRRLAESFLLSQSKGL